MAAAPPPVERLLGDYGGANAPLGRMTIVNQLVNVAHFPLHPSTIRQLERRPFSGKINEDANKHLQRFLTMTTSLKIEGHSEEAKKLVMFPFTLSEDAEEWFYSLPTGSITTWQQMETTFLNEYFPASKYIRKRYDIVNFKQKEGESLGDAYKRFKRLLNFVHGLRMKTKQLIDTATGGSTNFTTATGIKKIIKAIAANEHLELYDRSVSQPEGIIDLKLASQVVKMEDQIAAEVERRLKKIAIDTQIVAQGVLPSSTVTNPRENNHVNAVTARNGKSKEVPKKSSEEEDLLLEVDLEIKENEVVNEEVTSDEKVVKYKVIDPKPAVKLPFPTRNKKKRQHEKNFEKFLDMFKKLELNIPFLEALEQMPTYPKFMKDIISKKRTIETNPIILTETCSVILQGMKVPVKKKDRGSVTILCTIRDRSFKKAIIELGASVGLMPLSIYKRLGIGKVQDTRMTLQFADHSVKRPYGIVEDVLVKIDKFGFGTFGKSMI
ncbi:uncharacterized protein LOC127122788 [Lathyrus oleraceus]|uniref:uncharacterized protein LOC127122788 n=1 Tax=Pisum sativum TaxID=3888 RepID=UPI0021D06DDE|nr:uncharacterized protein LOC127122788 [Pisum sativum]